MKISKIEERYLIVEGSSTISVSVNEKGISIHSQKYFNRGFVFRNSQPEVIFAISKLLLEASKIRLP